MGWVGITTNGCVRRDGCCVMGRGTAKQALSYYPGIAFALGTRIKAGGNHVYLFPEMGIFSFPVKHHWQEPADLDLIERSAFEVSVLACNRAKAEQFYLPRPGCGNGRLLWKNVKPVLKSLGWQFTIVELGGIDEA